MRFMEASLDNVLEADTTTKLDDPCIYLCGNSLGLQPRRTSDRIRAHLGAWATKGVLGHFTSHDDSPLPPFINVDEVAAERMAKIVGAAPSEVAVMDTLTVNLHILMASFYHPNKDRWKIIIEGKAFPSDHYAVESQICHHKLDPAQSMVFIEPQSSDDSIMSTEHVLSVIDKHASTTALILLPGVQFYTGQYFDIPTITAHAHSKGILIGWDLAHAVGNVDVRLHDWEVDFAAWCNYKYMNSGPGAIGGLFVHEVHGKVDMELERRGKEGFRPRLSGWWGGDKATRFKMDNKFVPIPGAAGYQISNPSALDLTSVIASLEVFDKTSMSAIRKKSLHLTGYLEHLLLEHSQDSSPDRRSFTIITPSNPNERGAQLSVKLHSGILEAVMARLESKGVVLDERKPDVIRVAPAPLYNTFSEVWEFVQIFHEACRMAIAGQVVSGEGSLALKGGREKNGWDEIK
ncbi:MAG: Kynureninase 1 [Pycnora praestabilis]|nr:MAG: Kynureninase 1 [Pycnora praestabilis]